MEQNETIEDGARRELIQQNLQLLQLKPHLPEPQHLPLPSLMPMLPLHLQPELQKILRLQLLHELVVKPHLVDDSGHSRTIGSACIGTVRGDMHDIGKNLVKIMLEGSNIEVIDLGADVPPEQFVETAMAHRCDIIACSSLLTTTMDEMRRVVTLAQEKGIRDRVSIFVGGAPISQSFCDEIHADVYTADAASAARAAVKLLTK